jgi:hypothetical protein
MPGLQQIQDMLERALGTHPMPNHDYFWRGKTRDELVATRVFGLPLIVPGRPDESNLLRAMRGTTSGRDGPNRLGADLLHALFRQIRVTEDDIALLERWVREGCPEVAPVAAPKARATAATAATEASDDTHVSYWRAIDDFFLPGLASPETVPHVNRMHFAALQRWLPAMVGGDPADWISYLTQPDVATSFDYIRHHQRRLIQEYYDDSQADLLDSLWKFGGNLLPTDPLSHALPQHTMNSVFDWFLWSPYLDASLRAPDAQAADLDLARGWQMGIVADGLLRTDADRPEGQRMPISDFTSGDPNLRSKVLTKYVGADASMLIDEMVRRARESGLFELPPGF